MLSFVAHITLQGVVDAYLRDQAKVIKQPELARRIGTKRQGVNAILNGQKGRRFTWEHLEKFAETGGIMTSSLLAELANRAWQHESEIQGSDAIPRDVRPKLLALPAKSESVPVDELTEVLRMILEELRRRK